MKSKMMLFAISCLTLTACDELIRSEFVRDPAEPNPVFLNRLNTLDRSCEQDSDCVVVSSDLACNKSYTAIKRSALLEYQQLVTDFREQYYDIACTKEWSDSYSISNYEAKCVEKAEGVRLCVADYLLDDEPGEGPGEQPGEEPGAKEEESDQDQPVYAPGNN